MSKELIAKIRDELSDGGLMVAPYWAELMKDSASALESQAREIEDLKLVAMAEGDARDAAQAELAALKAKPGGVALTSLIEALKFYANEDHLLLADPDAWDTCSGEPFNFLHDDAGTASVEDGSIAKAALERLSQPASAGDERPISSCLRGQFETWAMETEHPVFGYIGSDWLDHGDDPNTYANDYMQGAWVMLQARAAISANHSEQALHMVPDAFLEASRRADDVLTAIIRNNEPIATLERTYGKDWHEAVGKIRTALILQIAAAPSVGSQGGGK